MQANDIGDIIARFIGSFEIATDADRMRQTYEDFLAARAREHAFKDGEGFSVKAPPLATNAPHNPDIQLSHSPFHIEHVRSGPVHVRDIEIAAPALGKLHLVHHGGSSLDDDLHAVRGPGFDHLSGAAAHRGAGLHREVVRPDGEVEYHESIGSTLLSLRQDGTLLDDDVFSAVEGLMPSAAPASDAADLAALIDQADAWSQAPEPTNDIAALKALLTIPAAVDPVEPGADAGGDGAPAQVSTAEPEPGAVPPGEGRSEHAGTYVNGESGGTAPDLAEIVKAHFEAAAPEPGTAEGPHSALASLGGNLLLNQTVLIQAATFGYTSVVLGDYHETNVIRQLNVLADDDLVVSKGAGLFTTGGSETFNVASFERIDPAEGHAAVAPFAFPKSYTVDVVEGDLLVSNFIRQIHKVGDGDSALFTSVEHSASIVMGGNEVLNVASFSQLTLGYDLVVFGGSVFEGNFIEQINLLFDRDRIGGDGLFAEGTSGTTGGNILYNKASILTIGTNDDFGDVDPAIRDLVGAFDGAGGVIPASLSLDLTYLGSSHLKVLYVTGDYVEINAISQLNILSDADHASYVDNLIGELTSDEAVWTVSTGDNILVNDATILDADAAGPRQLGGQYYSDSVLIQADLVSGGDGIEVFDTAKLASELVAFTSDEAGQAGGDDAAHHHTGCAYDAPTEGVGNILV